VPHAVTAQETPHGEEFKWMEKSLSECRSWDLTGLPNPLCSIIESAHRITETTYWIIIESATERQLLKLCINPKE